MSTDTPPTNRPKRCQHTDCGGRLIACVSDRFLPWYIERFECRRCEEWYLLDIATGAVAIDR